MFQANSIYFQNVDIVEDIKYQVDKSSGNSLKT